VCALKIGTSTVRARPWPLPRLTESDATARYRQPAEHLHRGPVGQLADAQFRAGSTTSLRPGLSWFVSGTLRLSSFAPGSSRGVPRYPQVLRCRRLDAFPASTTR
jgi:hypothetical protein